MKKNNNTIHSIIFFFRFIFRYCFKEAVLSVITIIIFGLQPAISAFITTRLVQSLTDGTDRKTSIFYLMLEVLITLLLKGIHSLQNYNNNQFSNKIIMQTSRYLIDTILEIPSEYFEFSSARFNPPPLGGRALAAL